MAESKNQDSKYTCPVCKREVSDLTSLVRHIQKHELEEKLSAEEKEKLEKEKKIKDAEVKLITAYDNAVNAINEFFIARDMCYNLDQTHFKRLSLHDKNVRAGFLNDLEWFLTPFF